VRTPNQRQAEQFFVANRSGTAIILADPAKYRGDGPLMVEWAKLALGEPSDREKPASGFRLVACSETARYGAGEGQCTPRAG
jgi:hypothetical protein